MDASDASQRLIDIVGAAKRGPQALAACSACRRSKLKCDAQRPCTRCRQRDIACQYTTRENETERQAFKRQKTEAEHEAEQLRHILLRVRDAQDDYAALAIVRDLRSRGTSRALSQVTRGSITADHIINTSELHRLKTVFLLSMMQSTADLNNAVTRVVEVLHPRSQLKLPSLAMYDVFKDKLISPFKLQKLLDVANSQVIEPKPSIDALYSGAPFWVSAAPWTLSVQSDEQMSHLISIFCSVVNPYVWFVEENAFIWAMRSGNPEHVFCSPLLVHAILALTSLYSEARDVFVQEGHYISRGEQFQQEACRLWQAEHGACKITNVQALLLLAVSCILRGQDDQSITFLHRAIELARDLPNAPGKSAVGEGVFRRVRQSIALSVACVETTWHLSYFQPSRTSPEEIAALATVVADLPDPIVYRQQYPFDGQPSPFEWRALQQHRVVLTQFFYEGSLIRCDADNNDFQSHADRSRAQAFLRRFNAWYRNLDSSVSFHSQASIAVIEFHAHCLGVSMILVDGLLKRFATDPEIGSDKGWQELHDLNLHYALLAGIVSQGYRRSYGVKITLPYMFHMLSVACFRLLEGLSKLKLEGVAPNLPEESTISGSDALQCATASGREIFGRNAWPEVDQQAEQPSGTRRDILSALKHCFRSLLGAGFHYLLARGVAQSVCVTASDMGIDLPDSITKLLDIAASSSWRASDLQACDITYPNYTVDRDADSSMGDEAQMIRWARRYEPVIELG